MFSSQKTHSDEESEESNQVVIVEIDPICEEDELCGQESLDVFEELALANEGKDPDETDTLFVDFYVDDSGSDYSGCGFSAVNPCQTIAYVEAKSSFGEGDIVHIGAGTYYFESGVDFNVQPNRIRAPHNNLTYIGAGSGQTIFDGTGMPEIEIFELEITGLSDTYTIDSGSYSIDL